MLTKVSTEHAIEWDIHDVVDNDQLRTEIFLVEVIASDEIILHILNSFRFRMQQYQNSSNKLTIGYGFSDPTTVNGITESEAYSDWLASIKRKQRELKNQLPVTTITQPHFDALYSLFVTTGNWRYVDSPQGRYNILDAITNDDWETVANMIANGNNSESSDRLFEARVLQLNDYSNIRSREWMRNEGIQYTRKSTVSGKFSETQQRQAEISYYRELGIFLPQTTELRKRAIDRIANI